MIHMKETTAETTIMIIALIGTNENNTNKKMHLKSKKKADMIGL